MHYDRHSVCSSIIRIKDLDKFAEDVLHETLTTCAKYSDLYEELNLPIYEVMDVATRKIQSMKCVPGFTNYGATASMYDLLKLTKRSCHTGCKSSGISVSENSVLDKKQIKNCSVAIQQITDEVLKKYLAAEVYSKLIENEKHSVLKSFEISPKMTINSETDLKLALNIDSEVMATEDHLDILMAKEMRFCKLRMEQRLRNSIAVKKFDTMNSRKMKNPVVILERLSSQLISHAVNGKPGEDKEYEETIEIRRNNILQKQRKTVATEKRSTVTISSCSCCCSEWTASPGLRRSKRLSSYSYRHSAISIPSSGRHSNFCIKNKNYSRRQYLDSDVLGNEENIPRHKRKTLPRKFSYSDDEEDFYGFEFPEKNGRRTSKLKKALKKLCAYTKGQENKNDKIVKEGSKNRSRQVTPLKEINRIEEMHITPDERIDREQPNSDFSSHADADTRNTGNETFTKQKFGDNYISRKRGEKLILIRTYKKMEKTALLVDKVFQDQRQNMRTRKFVNGNCYYNPLDYYNSGHYIVQTGRQIPLWSEENLRSAIMRQQEKIPVDLIASYLHNPQPITLAGLFGSPSKPYLW